MLHCAREGDSSFTKVKWGRGLSVSAYAAFIDCAKRLYGEHICSEFEAVDQQVFTRSVPSEPTADLPSPLVELIEVFGYMPLPLCFGFVKPLRIAATVPDYGEEVLRRHPKLAPLMVRQGERK